MTAPIRQWQQLLDALTWSLVIWSHITDAFYCQQCQGRNLLQSLQPRLNIGRRLLLVASHYCCYDTFGSLTTRHEQKVLMIQGGDSFSCGFWHTYVACVSLKGHLLTHYTCVTEQHMLYHSGCKQKFSAKVPKEETVSLGISYLFPSLVSK